MKKMDGLLSGVAEMRSVARRLNEWADDLEASFHDPETDAAKVSAAEPGSAEKEDGTAGSAGAESEAASEKGKTFTLPEVRMILAEKCAAGFAAQVKALIESYGASSLREVPADRYGDLLEAVKGLGDADAG